ncbi:MAG: hypothetical protein ACOCWF_08980 [Halochromatium sp.]
MDQFEQLHIDVARNATDDFNPFHDPHRWNNIQGNPYSGPIVLGFQLESLADYRIERQRQHESEREATPLPFSNYEFVFAAGLRPGEAFTVQVRRTQHKTGAAAGTVNRVVMRKTDGSPIMVGSRCDAAQPRFLPDWNPVEAVCLDDVSDRSFIADGSLFVKRKYMTTSNAKNFLLASLVDQRHYIDELDERVLFPPVFTSSLLSCALLERGRIEGCDFESDPHVYVSHHISVDRRLQQALRSNDRIDMVVAAPIARAASPDGVELPLDQASFIRHRCVGIVAGRGTLFRCDVQTARLRYLLSSTTPHAG